MTNAFDKILYRNEVENILKESQSIICNKSFSKDKRKKENGK